MTIQGLALLLEVLIGVSAILYLLMPGQRLGLANTDRNASTHCVLCACVGLLVFFVAHGLFRAGQVFLVCADEYCRVNYALDWSITPFFAPADHVWLPGQFYVLGLFQKLFHNIRMVVSVTSLLGCGMAVYFGFSLGQRLWDSPIAGLGAAIMVGTEWVLLWASTNPQAEVFFYPALLGAMNFWLAGWERLDNSRELEERRGAERCFLASALFAGFGNMFRYEMWYGSILLGIFLGLRFFVLARTRAGLRLVWYALLGCFVLLAYPVAWMISSSIHLGSPFAFLASNSKLMFDGNLFYDFSSPLARFLTYPKIMIQDHWPQLILPISGIILLFLQRKRKGLMFLMAYVALLLLSMIICIKGGVGSNNRARYSEFLVLPLLCVGTGPIAFLWSYPKGLIRVLGRGVVLCFLLVTATASVHFARANYPHHWSVPLSLLDTVNRLERENDSSRSGHYRIQPPYSSLQIYAGEDYVPFWTLRYHSMWPESIHRVHDLKQLQERLDAAMGRTHFLLLTGELISIVPRSNRLLAKTDAYELWEVTGP